MENTRAVSEARSTSDAAKVWSKEQSISSMVTIVVKYGLGILAQRPCFGHGQEQGIAVTGSLWQMPFWSKAEQEQGIFCVFTIWHKGHFGSKMWF